MATFDVNKYQSPHEPSHQWDLRRRFMEMHMGRFDEDRLVCLSQTFANIEFLGCRLVLCCDVSLLFDPNCLNALFRYPKATMDIVEELAFGIVQQYREEQKGRLQRTFVSGSDAANRKVNRAKPKF
jgi:hypothetical protein